MRGKFIVIGGNDGAGKRTQSELLANRLFQIGSPIPQVHRYSFPRYDTFWGQLIASYLRKPGSGSPLPEEICEDTLQIAVLYELDRRAASKVMDKCLEAGDWIVCDRYTESNLAHQAVKFPTSAGRNDFVTKLLVIQKELELPQPDLTIILSLPPDIRDRRVESRRSRAGRNNGQISAVDRHEQNRPYMEQVNAFYPLLAEKFGWPVINCVENQLQLSIEQVHERVWQVVAETFGL